MPALSSHKSSSIVKLLLLGDSGTGKTGALASLAVAGYRLHILDFDNGLDSLVRNIRRLKPDALASVDYESLRDKIKGSPVGPIMDGMPQAFTSAMRLLDKWSDGTAPSKWGPQDVLVLDSLTFMSEAAYNWADALNPGAKDKRQVYGAAQDAVENVIALLTSPNFEANVVVIAHVKYMERPDGTTKGFPTSIGNALSPKLPAYFNTVAVCETRGIGKSVSKIVSTVATPMLDLKNPAAALVELPNDTGLAKIFEILKAPQP